MQPPLKPGELPSITDTDPPPLHPATEVGDGYVRVDEEKLKSHAKAEEAKPQAERYDPASHPAHPEHQNWLERMRHHPQQERSGKH